jgi:predicted metalloendopeptidase
MQENIVNSPDLTAVAVEGYVVRIHRPVALEAPRAADLLRSLPPDKWLGTVEDMVEYGATALLSVKTSATVQLLERQMADLVDQLRSAMVENLGQTLQTDRELAKETLMRLLNEHSGSMTKLLGRYVDPNSKEGLPAVMAQQLEQVTKSALRQVDTLLQDGDESALGKLAAKLTKQIEAVEMSICEKIAARNALITKSMQRQAIRGGNNRGTCRTGKTIRRAGRTGG